MAYVFSLLLESDYGFMETLLPQFNVNPGLLKAAHHDPDLPTFQEAMRGPYAEEFKKAMAKEVEELEQHDTWDEVPESSVPDGANVLPGTWVFRIMRYPDGRLRKIKAKLCVRGDKQLEGVDYFEQYAPVVKWSAVRLFLAITLQQGWVTRQVDFKNAVVHAKNEKDVYVKLPQTIITKKICNTCIW